MSLAWLVVLTLVDGRYGFHHDELNFPDQSRHLAWGYVEYPWPAFWEKFHYYGSSPPWGRGAFSFSRCTTVPH